MGAGFQVCESDVKPSGRKTGSVSARRIQSYVGRHGEEGWFAEVVEKARELVFDGQFASGFVVGSLRDLSECAYMQDRGKT